MNHEPPDDRSGRTERGLLRRFSSAVIALSILTIILPLAATLFARHSWACDLATHFRVQYVALLFPVAIFCLVTRRRKTAIAFTAVLIVAAVPVIRYYVPSGHQDPGVEALRFVTFNVQRSNSQFDDAVSFLRSENPDVIALLEIDSRWKNALQELSNDYPFSRWETREDNFGLCVLSKIPWQDVEVVQTDTIQCRPSILVRFEINGSAVQYIATHPATPMTPESAQARNDQLMALCEVFDPASARIFTGDFNLTPWSPRFQDVTASAGVTDGARGFGAGPTWCQLPTPLGGIKIDHFLISEDIFVSRLRVGPDLGSDHRPVIADLKIGSKADSAPDG